METRHDEIWRRRRVVRVCFGYTTALITKVFYLKINGLNRKRKKKQLLFRKRASFFFFFIIREENQPVRQEPLSQKNKEILFELYSGGFNNSCLCLDYLTDLKAKYSFCRTPSTCAYFYFCLGYYPLRPVILIRLLFVLWCVGLREYSFNNIISK